MSKAQVSEARIKEFFSLEGLYVGLGKGVRDKIYPQFSDHYFTGDYPIKPPDNQSDKVTQLSLLSAKSIG